MRKKRYDELFSRLKEKGEGAFVPFVMLGDPDGELCAEIIDTLVESGADALELGIPFSDPVADGPVIQTAAARALASGATPRGALAIVAGIRRSYPQLPIGLLVYANLVSGGGLNSFYSEAAAAGVDSILVADAPTVESAPFVSAAREHGVEQIFIAPPNAGEAKLRQLASLGGGYTYYLGRAGVTGADRAMAGIEREKIKILKSAGAPPIVVGFGVSTPEHVAAALRAGADGAISGSAVVKIIEDNLGDSAAMRRGLAGFVREMKAASTAG